MPEPTCIDLVERFGKHFRIVTEDGSNSRDPWIQQIACKRGHIGVWGGDILVASVDVSGRVLAKLLVAAPSARIAQLGDSEANVVFHVQDFYAVARIMQPRKRRKISPEHLAKLQASNAMYRFTDGTGIAQIDARRYRGEQPGSEVA